MNHVPTQRRNRQVTKLSEYLRISEAADYLGVSPNTLRNWERVGKIVAHRHPMNDYRLFKREELDVLLDQAQKLDEPPKPTGKPK
jgi:MerR family copper efflux transcriptional regulator